ncbi:MAG: SLBB domain-containing protein [Alloprevotella sp.]
MTQQAVNHKPALGKACLALLLFFFTFTGEALAQSPMTDSQIMEFVVKENDKGTPREEIFKRLIERGVSVEDIRRIREKYEKQNKNNVVGGRNIEGSQTIDRMRQNNGQTRRSDNAETNKYFKQRQTAGNRKRANKSEMNDFQRRRYEEQEMDEYADAFDFILPDTLDMMLPYEQDYKRDRKNGKEVFGRNIFNNKSLTFESDMNVAIPQNYRLGPGDAVFIDIWGASEQSVTATVSPEGTITIEGCGPVNVNGLTVAQANQRVKGVMQRHYAGSNIQLTVGQTKTISVNVMGEVQNPGTYTLSAFATVFHALYMAGGTNDIGTLRNIKVYRGGRLISTVDIYDYILNGNLKGNVTLASDDVIAVDAYDCLVDITGKVKRPMVYEMKSNESLATLLKYAGGFAGDAYEDVVHVVRKKGGRFSVYSLDEYSRADFHMCDGDSVAVDSTLNRYTNMVEAKGAVMRPGKYQYGGSITTVSQLLATAGGLAENAYAEHAILRRRKADRSLEVLSINPRAIMDHTLPDVALQNEDELFVPDRTAAQEERTLTIEGEVIYPGTYDFAENMSVEDLILQAGGLKDAASLVKVDVARRQRDKLALTSSNNVAQMFSFKIKDGFTIDGEKDFTLEPFDEVYVRRSPDYVEQQHVTIQGEVAFPGIYTITKKGMRLSEIIQMCGGVLPEGYAKGARLERKLTEAERIRQRQLLRMSTTSDSLDTRKLEVSDIRFVGIYLDKAIANPGSEWDLVVQEGDRLIVPLFNNTVSVQGEVMYPNTVGFKKGEKLKYYINQSGGFSLKAKKDRVFAIHMNGTVTRVKSAKDIEPGCEILVPTKRKRQAVSITQMLSLGMTIATLGSVIVSVLK